jgi:hypothetical protein
MKGVSYRLSIFCLFVSQFMYFSINVIVFMFHCILYCVSDFTCDYIPCVSPFISVEDM